MTTNQIALRDVKAKEKANLIREQELAETSAHNRSTERYTEEHYIRQDQAALTQAWAASSQATTAEKNQIVNAINAQTNAFNAETSRMTYAETVQHNRATEAQEVAKLTEQQRSNIANESIKWQEVVEKQRHNKQDEAIGYMNAAANDLKATTEAGNAVRNALYDSSVLKLKTSEQLQKAYEYDQNLAFEREKFERSKTESDRKAAQYDTELAIKAAGTELKGLELQYKTAGDTKPNTSKLAEWVIDPLRDFTDRVLDKLSFGAIY